MKFIALKLVKIFPCVRIAYTYIVLRKQSVYKSLIGAIFIRYTERIGWKFPFRDVIRRLLASGDPDLGVVSIV